jgi:hypothetical protein
MPVDIDLDDEVDRWKWRCPAGHTSWEATNEHFWCRNCARSLDEDVAAEFDELRNAATGETVGRDEIRLFTEAGSYRSVYGTEGAP